MHFYPRLLNYTLLIFSILSSRFSRAAEVYPVLATLQINPPYSLYLSDYSAAGSDKMQVNLFLKDLTKSNYPCRLRFKIEGFGITIQSKNDFYTTPLSLNGGELSTFSGADLEPYLNPKNLVFQGLDQAAFSRNGGKLPEGVYRISVEVLDYYQRSVVSNSGNTVLSVFLSYPPVINSPPALSKVQALDPQNVLFQWVPRHTGSLNAAYNVAYKFKLVELIPPERDPNDAIRSTRPLFETYTDQTLLLYGPAEPALTRGNSYAVQVQAVEADGKDLFINNGNSEVVKFTYGEKCSPPVSVLAELADANSLKISWASLPLQQAFSIRYREANNSTANWFEQEIYTTNYTARGLRPGKTYEYQVKAECTDGYGDYTPLQQFQMPDEKLTQGDFICGQQVANIHPDKSQLLDLLLKDNVFYAGDFSISVTDVSSSPGNGVFSGTGVVTVPVFGYLKFSVAFNNITLNSKYQLVNGSVQVGTGELDSSNTTTTNGLDVLKETLTQLSDAFSDLLKELKKDKPNKEVLKKGLENINSNISSWPKTGNAGLQNKIDNLTAKLDQLPATWAGLDDPAVKDAVIANVIKTQQEAKELRSEIAELKKEIALSEKCNEQLDLIISLINNNQININFLKLLACEDNKTSKEITTTGGKKYNLSTYTEPGKFIISDYKDAWPNSVNKLFSIKITDTEISKLGITKFWISYDPNNMYRDGKLPVTIYLKDTAPLINDPTHCRKDIADFPKGISAGAAFSDALGETVFYSATLGVSLEATAVKKTAQCAGGVVLDVSFQIGINAIIKTYLNQKFEFSDLVKEVSVPSAATSCVTAAFVKACNSKCAGLAGFAAGAGDDILRQISSGKKLSEVKIKQVVIKGLMQGIIAYGTQNIVNFASKTWTKYNTKQLTDALEDAEHNPGKYFGEEEVVGSIVSKGGKTISKEVNDIVDNVFSNSNNVNKIINGSSNTDHLWQLLVPNKNADAIADIIKETLEYGATIPYKTTASSKVLDVTRNGITKQVQVPFIINNGKLIFGDAWIIK